MYLTALAFYPNQANPARASGRGVWRVKACTEAAPADNPRVITVNRILILRTRRRFKEGSRIDPKKALLQ